MNSKQYTSFEEVDRDLKILQLRRQIAQEELKGDIGDLKSMFEPPQLFASFGEGFLKKLLISWLMGFLLRRVRRK